MKRLMMILGLLAIITGCTTCENRDVAKAIKVEKEVKHVVRITYYIHQSEPFNVGQENYYPMPDAIREPWREATGRIQDAVDGRIEFVEVNSPLSADILLCFTDTHPSTLAYWDKLNGILAVNRMANHGNVMQTLLHETLHACGIGHSGDCNCIMYFNASGGIGVPIITKKLRDKLLKILDGRR
jgi:hypothetical protein